MPNRWTVEQALNVKINEISINGHIVRLSFHIVTRTPVPGVFEKREWYTVGGFNSAATNQADDAEEWEDEYGVYRDAYRAYARQVKATRGRRNDLAQRNYDEDHR